MNLQRAYDELLGIAEQIKHLQCNLQMPLTGEVDPAGAITKLRSVLGPRIHVAIRPPDIDSYAGDQPLTVQQWGVYLGVEAPNGAHGTHLGASLTASVNAALKACEVPDPVDVEAQIEAVKQAYCVPEELPL